MKRLVCLVVAAMLICTSTISAFAAQTTKTVKVAVMNYPNFIEHDVDGTVTGYAAEYLADIAEKTGWTYEYVDYSFSDALNALHNGEVDIVVGTQKAPGREELYDFSEEPMGENSALLCVLSGNNKYAYQDYQQFQGMRVGGIVGSAYVDLCKEFMADNNIESTMIEFKTNDEARAALDNGEVDALIVGTIRYSNDYKVIANLTPTDMYFACNPQDPSIKEEIDAAQAQIHAENRYYEMALDEKYFSGIQHSNVFNTAEQKYIQEAGAINLGYVSTQDPVSYQDKDTGEFSGMTREILDRISQMSGLKFNYIALPAGEISYDYLKANQIGLISSVEYTAINRASKGMSLTKPYLNAQKVFVGKSNVTFDKDASYVVAMATGSGSVEEFLQTKYPNFTILPCESVEASFQALLDGKADIVMQDQYVVTYLLSKPQYERLSAFPVDGLSDQLCLSTIYITDSQGNPDPLTTNPALVSILNKCIEQINQDDVAKIVAEYTTGKPYRLTTGDMLYKFRVPFIIIAILFAFCIVLFAHIVRNRQKNFEQIQTKNLQLADAVSQAERANRAKSQFLSRMSHEIRTPMNAIVGLTTIARTHDHEPEKVDEYLTKIDSSSKVLLGIINDVLDMSAIESEKLKIANAEFDLKQMLETISNIYYTQCKGKGISFNMGVDLSAESVIGDALRVNQILMNLISNAYKFTGKGGTVKVSACETDRKDKTVFIRFTVADTGCGMTEEMQTRLFKPFEQESAITAQKTGGSGLGLSIAKNLVDMMHGAIKVESKKNEGTTFTVDLPFGLTGHKNAIDPEKLRNMLVLIVDDDPNERLYTSVVLDRIGMQYDVACSAQEAMDKMNEREAAGKTYDICFTDWKMPGINGVQLTKMIRGHFGKNTLVIIVSAYDLSEVQDEAKQAGADMFITKPLFQSSVFNAMMQITGGVVKHTELVPEHYDFSGHKLLLAEDNEMNTEVATDILELVNMKVDHAENGKIALEMFEKSAPGTYDLILMDVQMPEMDGYQATQAIRACSHAEAKTIPIYAMTANAFTDDVSRAISSGMNGHLAKPIDTAVLYRTIGNCLK